jgi:hypothetical protein
VLVPVLSVSGCICYFFFFSYYSKVSNWDVTFVNADMGFEKNENSFESI